VSTDVADRVLLSRKGASGGGVAVGCRLSGDGC
jgi:hypothetical protein